MSIDRRWDIQGCRNPWFSVGLHVDHHDPSITFHLPFAVVCIGRCKQPGFGSLIRKLEVT